MTEDQLQIACADWLQLFKPKCISWHTPNEGRHKPQYMVKRKRMGVLSGVPDFAFGWGGGKLTFIELKVGKNRLSPNQEAFRDQCVYFNIPHVVCRDLEHFITTVTNWDTEFCAVAA